ncbi:MAG: DUF456 domain-containing protein [Bacteroidia bacterium]|nr:DUF456 domain-containing protein [Bacteroidia bacterium]
MYTDYLLILFSLLFCFAGLAGCIIPGLPGPPLNYVALILLQWAFSPFSVTFLIVWAVIVFVIAVLDYMLPVWTAKKFGATRQGIIGSIAGMILGVFFTPIGMITGLIAGAIIGDLIAGRQLHKAVGSGAATAFGTLLTIGIKLIVSGILAFYTVFEAGTYLWVSWS